MLLSPALPNPVRNKQKTTYIQHGPVLFFLLSNLPDFRNAPCGIQILLLLWHCTRDKVCLAPAPELELHNRILLYRTISVTFFTMIKLYMFTQII
jgi:hypothetical protein